MNEKKKTAIKRLEQQIDEPIMESEYPEEWLKAGVVATDQAFLAKCKEERSDDGTWRFTSSIEFDAQGGGWDSPRFKEEAATQIWGLAEDMARSMGRCRTLVKAD
jgi:hypothetical protein